MTARNNPKISVCIPTYNYGQYLPDAIESVLAQSFRNYELIVVDNCSTDNTGEITQKYLKDDPRIRFIRNEANLGMAGNWNRCLSHATGEYVKILCADDVLAPTCLEKSVGLLEDNPEIALVSCARLLVDKDLTPVTTLSYSSRPELIEGHAVIQKCLIHYMNFVGEPTAVLFRKRHAARGFNTHYRQLLDLEMWFHLLEQGKFAYLDEPLCSFRTHSNQETRRNVEQHRHLQEPFDLLKDYANKPYIACSLVERIYMSYAPAFEIWKFHKKYHEISLRSAINKIRTYYGLTRFIFFYPVYKLYKASLSIKKRIKKMS